jgi:hypothetical protein
MSEPQPAKHPSLEKTDSALHRSMTQEPVSVSKDDLPSDAALLKDELAKKTRNCTALLRAVDELKTALEALRNDFGGQQAEHLVEVKALKDVLQKTHAHASALEEELMFERQASKQLKAQNLDFQYYLNLWGIPVSSGQQTGGAKPAGPVIGDETFFPALIPLTGTADPVPPVLRGDLLTFCFPDLLHFLANSSLEGVLTVVTDGIVSKLYLEKNILQFAGWNNRDPDLRLAMLLEESGLVQHDALVDLDQRALYDLELANLLVTERNVPDKTVRSGLREHARVILGFLFHLKRGSFIFQPGHIQPRRELLFRLSVTDLLLKTAAEMDEKTRLSVEKR